MPKAKADAKAVLRALELKRKLTARLADTERAIKANGRILYDRHGYYGGIDERLVETLAVKELAA